MIDWEETIPISKRRLALCFLSWILATAFAIMQLNRLEDNMMDTITKLEKRNTVLIEQNNDLMRVIERLKEAGSTK